MSENEKLPLSEISNFEKGEEKKEITSEIKDIIKEGEKNINATVHEVAESNKDILVKIKENPDAIEGDVDEINQAVVESEGEIEEVLKEKDDLLAIESNLENKEEVIEENKEIGETKDLFNKELGKIDELKNTSIEVKNIIDKSAKEKNKLLFEKITQIEGKDASVVSRRLARTSIELESLSTELGASAKKIRKVEELLKKQPDSSLQEKNNVLKEKYNELLSERYQTNAGLDLLLKKLSLENEKEEIVNPSEADSKILIKKEQNIKDIEEVENIENANQAIEKMDKLLLNSDINSSLDNDNKKDLAQRIFMKFVFKKKPMDALRFFDNLVNKEKSAISPFMAEITKNMLKQIENIDPNRHAVIKERLGVKINLDNYNDLDVDISLKEK